MLIVVDVSHVISDIHDLIKLGTIEDRFAELEFKYKQKLFEPMISMRNLYGIDKLSDFEYEIGELNVDIKCPDLDYPSIRFESKYEDKESFTKFFDMIRNIIASYDYE